VKFYKLEQGSVAWYNARLGIPTSSNFHKILTPGGKASEQARKYMYRLIAERLLRESMDDQIGYIAHVERGKENEQYAVAQFQNTNQVVLEPGGFVTTDDGMIGASPDRLFKSRKESLEVKCPAPWTQIGYMLEGPGLDYRPQVQGHLLVGEFDAVHFYSWHPQMPAVHRVALPDVSYMATLRDILGQFNYQLERATMIARDMGAYAVASRVERPFDAAYGDPSDAPIQIITPGKEGDDALGDG
jgi:hypothetical protein